MAMRLLLRMLRWRYNFLHVDGMFMENNKTSKKLTLSGLLLALNAIILLSINYIPTNTIFLMAISSLFASIIIIESEIKFGSIFSLASIFFAFIIFVNKAHFVTYLLTFGNYGVVKYLIEHNFELKIQFILKAVYSICVFLILYFIVTQFMAVKFNPIYLIVMEAAYFVYDYVYTMFIDYYLKKLRNIIKFK